MLNPSFRVRRSSSLLVTAGALVLLALLAWLQESRLSHASFLTGAAVLACLLILILLGLRRRIPVLPLGTVAMWTQIHIYTGLFAVGAFLLHVPALIGNGVFECGLSIVFWLVSASGLYGIVASRTLPKRLTAVEGQLRFDRVRWHRTEIDSKATELLDSLTEHSSMRVLGSFFANELRPFFASGPSLAYALVPTGSRRRRLLGGLKELDQYLEADGRHTSGKFAALVRRRDDLDYQWALQLRLRLWLVIHSFFSVVLVSGGIIHTALVWRFAG